MADISADLQEELDQLQAAYKAAVDEWVKAIREEEALASGAIETRPIDDDPGVIELLRRLSRVSRRRWPDSGDTRKRIPVRIG